MILKDGMTPVHAEVEIQSRMTSRAISALANTSAAAMRNALATALRNKISSVTALIINPHRMLCNTICPLLSRVGDYVTSHGRWIMVDASRS